MKRLNSLTLCLLLATGCGDTTSTISGDDGGTHGDDAGPAGPFALAAGQVAEVALHDGTAAARLATPGGNERFLLVLASTQFAATGDVFDYSVATAALPSTTPAPTRVTGCSIDAATWQAIKPPVETPPSGKAPTVGDTRKLTISVSGGVNGGTQQIDAQVAAVGERAVVWVDVTPGHPANLDMAVITDFLTDFDALILPRERSVFGVESDLDGDGRIGLVFTSLTYKTAVAFFTGCDLAALPGCHKGNGGEFLYLTPPAAIAPPYNTPAAIKETLAHELGHLIHFNRKVLRNKLAGWDDAGYMIEGFGGFAQDVIGYQAGNLYVAMAGLDGVDQLSLGDVLADGTPYDKTRDGVLRGDGYLFVRWLYDRAGGDLANADGTIDSRGGPSFVRALLDARDSVAAALPLLTKAPAADIAMDFLTTLGASNREHTGDAMVDNACFRYLPATVDPKTGKPRGADLFTSFHGMMMSGPALQTLAEADGQLRAGGVEYIELVTSGAELDVAVTVTGDAAARVRLVRVR